MFSFEAFALTDRVAVVVGAGPGMGASIAHAYAAAGASVVLAARDESRLGALQHEIEAAGGRATVVGTDVADDASLVELVERTGREVGPPDIVFYNAHANGLAGSSSDMPGTLDATYEVWEGCFRINMWAPYRIGQLVMPEMKRRGRGVMTFMVSNAAFHPVMGGLAAYGATKAGLATLVQYLAKEGGPEVRVNALCPGAMTLDGVALDVTSTLVSKTPIGRAGRSRDIAAAALFLASDASSFMTGEMVRLDGGRMRAGG